MDPALQNTESKGTANFKEQKKKKTTLREKTASSVLRLQPDVLFRDEFSSLHSAIVIYIGPAWTNEGFFPPQRKDKDRRRRKLFAIWSINKNANSGKPFLSCDNGGVVIVAPKDSETDGPARIHKPEFFIFKLKHRLTVEVVEGVRGFLSFCKCCGFVQMIWWWLSPHRSRCRADTRGGGVTASKGLSINHCVQDVLEGKSLEGQVCWEKVTVESSQLEDFIAKDHKTF